MPGVMWERVGKSKWLTPKVLVIVSILSLLVFVFSASRALAATTHHVKVGGEIMGLPLAKGGMVWYNGYDPSSIVIHPGDTIVWDGVGGVHTVTSADVLSNGSLAWDSSPGFVEGPPPPVMLPGQSFSHTFNEAGTFEYFCKVHAYRIGESWVGMMGIVHVVPLTSLDAVNAAASGASAVGYGALGLSIVALLVAVYAVVRGKGPRGSPPTP